MGVVPCEARAGKLELAVEQQVVVLLARFQAATPNLLHCHVCYNSPKLVAGVRLLPCLFQGVRLLPCLFQERGLLGETGS
eukprot:4835768-Prymnesium_polylepis.1